jgi:glycosyltransferase involved in cell wall biosynthesis
MLSQMARYYGAPRQGEVIYNGRNPGLLNPHASKDDLVVSVGRLWDAGKQVSLLLQHDHRIPVSIAGSGKGPDEVISGAVPAYGARRGVEFRGLQPHPQLAQLFSRASIYAATSQYEPFGLAPLEAALSRCALVANDIPSFREIWGEAAVYFETDNARSLAAAIERLRSERELRLEHANLAYERARQRYTAERMVNDYLSLYGRLLGGGAITDANLPAEVRAA